MTDLTFGRAACGDYRTAVAREWLVANGIGGYASGTIAGSLTRRYHGLLVAALKPPLGRTLLVAKLDESARYDGIGYPLSCNHWASGSVDARGVASLERFALDGAIPVWTYALADALLEKRVWMEPLANTTYVSYRLVRGLGPVDLVMQPLVDYRDYHGGTHAGHDGETLPWPLHTEIIEGGVRLTMFDGAAPYIILVDGGDFSAERTWYRDYYLALEAERGLDATEDHLCAGEIRASLQMGQTLTIILSAEVTPRQHPAGPAAHDARLAYDGLIVTRSGHASSPPAVRALVLAADTFLVRRPLPAVQGNDATSPVAAASGGATLAVPVLSPIITPYPESATLDGHTVLAGYHWFGDWGRDTMVSLPGLTLATGRPHIARRILQTFARYTDMGMLPNRFPDGGEAPEYNTVDASLLFVEALRAYHAATGDDDLLREVYPTLQDILAWYHRGTRYNIGVDPADGLVRAGQDGVQLTWMDAKVGDWVVTPRQGKPVEVNALWYNAVRAVAEIARQLGDGISAATYDAWGQAAATGFARYWNAERAYLYDVLDGPGGPDPALRPNALLAVSLEYSPLDIGQQRAVVDTAARHLLTSHGLRSLAPDDPAYQGVYTGDTRRRDGAYHQGTVWGWLIGPFVAAHLRVYRDRTAARAYLAPLLEQVDTYGVGSIGEIFDGDAPFSPRGCIAQAWSVAEVLRAWDLTGEPAPGPI